MLHWIHCYIVFLCSYGSSSFCIGLIVILFFCVLMVLPHNALNWLWYCLSVFSWFFLMLHWIDYDIVYLCSYGSSSCCIGLIVALFICVLRVQPYVALERLWHCLSVLSRFFLMLHLIDCDIVNMFSRDSSSCCIWLIVILFICVLMVLPRVALYWLWQCLSAFLWFFLMLHWFDCDIVYLCSYGSSSCCIGLIVTLFVFVLMVLPHFALDSLLHCFSLFLWFFLILHWIDCDTCIVFLCSYVSTSCWIELIVVLFICVLMVLPHVALDWLWHCLSVFLSFYLMLHCIDCDIVYLCVHGSSSCCLGLIVISFFCVFMVLRHVAFDLLWHCLSLFSWFFLMFHWIDCDIVYLCSYGSSLCCIGLIVTFFICFLIGLLYFSLNWLWHCLSVFSWFFLMSHWIDCGIVYLCSHGSYSCCLGLIVALFICVLMVLSHVALDWLWHCLSVFSWFFLMLPWIDCDIIYLTVCSFDSSAYCLGLIVTLFICVLMVLPHDALDWLWHCLPVFLFFFLMLHWIDCDIVYLCSHGSSSCCIGLIVTSFICVLMVLPHVALDWFWYRFFCVFMVLRHDAFDLLWHCLSLFSWFFLVLHWIDRDIDYLCSYGSSLCCIGLIVTLFICVLIVLPYVALNWLWHCLSVFSWFYLMSHWIDCGIVYLCSHCSYSCCIGLIMTVFICVLMGLPYVAFDWLWHCLMVLPHVALDWLWHCLSLFSWFLLMLHWIDCDIVL